MFKKGNPGGPGRPRKTNEQKRTDKLLRQESSKVVDAAIKNAKAGKAPGVAQLFVKEAFKKRLQKNAFKLPKGSIEKQSKALVRAVGKYSKEELEHAARILESRIKVVHVVELENAVKKLQKLAKKPGGFRKKKALKKLKSAVKGLPTDHGYKEDTKDA